jgi:glycosyltransferase involved in cell wall biosynthesis
MRVLLITGSFPPMTCGVGDYTHALAGALAGRPGVEVGVLTSAEAGPTGSEKYPVFPAVRDWKRADFAEVKAVVGSFKPDVVHLQYPTAGYRNTLAWQLPIRLSALGLPVVQTWPEYFPRELRLALPHIIMGLPPGDLIVVRPGYEREMSWWSRLLMAHKRMHLISNAPTIPKVVLTDVERAAVRERFGAGGKALLAFFGFLFENKGIDDVLRIMDPQRHHLVLVGDVKEWDPYQRDLLHRVRQPPLAGSVTVTGFVPAGEAATVLAAADAVVLTFREGGGSWNTTIKAAALQGTFVLTTSRERHGFDADANIYYARPGDTEDMKQALALHLGRRNPNPSPEAAGPSWQQIAERHIAIYQPLT